MVRFGQFEAVSLIGRSDHASVWAARPAGGKTAAALCLKRVDRDAAAPARELVAAAVLQRSVAERSAGWAAVHEVDATATEAFCVVQRFPRSAQTIVDGSRRLTSNQLRTILMAVLDALIELQAWHGRPHGNLKPTNVLIGRHIRPGQICLTDPAAKADHVPSLTRAPDPRAIGRLLFALVTHRPATVAPWPLKFDPSWAALGRSGRQWFDLCASLMSPRGALSPDLDAVLTMVAAIRPTRRRLPRPVFAVAAIAALATAGFVYRAPLARGYGWADQQVRAEVASLRRPAKKPKRKPAPAIASPPSRGGRQPVLNAQSPPAAKLTER